MLGSSIFGEYGAIKNTLVSIAIFSTFGLGYTATKYVAELKNRNQIGIKGFIRKSLIITLIISFIFCIVTIIFSNYISLEVLKAPNLSTILRYVAVWIVFNALTTLQIGILSGLGMYKEMARINTYVGIVTFLLSILLTYFFGFDGAILALLIAQIYNWYLYYKSLNNSYSDGFDSSVEVSYLDILRFCTPIAMQEMVYSFSSWLSYLILIHHASYSEFGIYSASLQWSSLVLFIPGVLRNVILSNLSKSNVDTEDSKILKQMILINLFCTILSIIIIMLAQNIILTIYGRSFLELKNVLLLALLTTIFISVSNIYTQAYMSKGKNWLMFFFRLIRDFGIVVLTYALIKGELSFQGAYSLVLSTLIMNIIFAAIMISIYHFYLTKSK